MWRSAGRASTVRGACGRQRGHQYGEARPFQVGGRRPWASRCPPFSVLQRLGRTLSLCRVQGALHMCSPGRLPQRQARRPERSSPLRRGPDPRRVPKQGRSPYPRGPPVHGAGAGLGGGRSRRASAVSASGRRPGRARRRLAAGRAESSRRARASGAPVRGAYHGRAGWALYGRASGWADGEGGASL